MPPARRTKTLLQAEICYGLLGHAGDILRYRDAAADDELPSILKVVEWSMPPAERTAVEACVLPGAYCAHMRSLIDAILEGERGSCCARAAAREADRILNEYSADVVNAERELVKQCDWVEGPSRLRFRLGHWVDALAVSCRALKAVRGLRGGQCVDALAECATKHQGSGKGAVLARRLARAAIRVALRQLSAWCTLGELVDPCDEFFVALLKRENKAKSLADDTQSNLHDENNETNEDRYQYLKEYRKQHRSVEPARLRLELRSETILSSESASSVLFVGGALRVLQMADEEDHVEEMLLQNEVELDINLPKTTYSPPASIRDEWCSRWMRIVQDCGGEHEVTWHRLARQVGILINETMCEVSMRLLKLARARGLASAFEAVSGIGLLRFGDVWHRALTLAMPSLSAAPHDRSALDLQLALEDAAKECGCSVLEGRSVYPILNKTDRYHRVRVIVDPPAFIWSGSATDPRFEILRGVIRQNKTLELSSDGSFTASAPRRLLRAVDSKKVSFRLSLICYHDATVELVAQRASSEKKSLHIAISSEALSLYQAGDNSKKLSSTALQLPPRSAQASVRVVQLEELDEAHRPRLSIRCYSVANLRKGTNFLLTTNLEGVDDVVLLGELRLSKTLTELLASIQTRLSVRAAGSPVRILGFGFTILNDIADEGSTPEMSQSAYLADRTAFDAAVGWRDALRLELEPAWPIGELLFAETKTKRIYDTAFRRLLAARVACVKLDAAWLALASNRNYLDGSLELKARRDLWTTHARIIHIVRSVHVWLQRDALEPAVVALTEAIRAATHFEAVLQAHGAFLVAIQQALLLDDPPVDAALDALFNHAHRLAALIKDHAHAPEDAPSSALAAIVSDFDDAADALFLNLPQLQAALSATADLEWFRRRGRNGK